jgi:hypothetical protein
VPEAREAAAVQVAAPARPEHPSVRFVCDGAAEICTALQATFDQELGRAGMPSVVDDTDAELLVDAVAVAGTPRSQEMFGTVMVTQTYTVSFVGTDRSTRRRFAMPNPASFSYDERYAQARLPEHVQAMTSAVLLRLRAYWDAQP